MIVEATPEVLDLVPPDRVDRWLAGVLTARVELPKISRNRLKSLILEGRVAVGDATLSDPSSPVKPGLVYRIEVPPPVAAEPEPEDLPLSVVFEDPDLIVIDKPAGLTVHPAPGQPDGTLVNALLAHCGSELSGIGGVRRPGIVHRIDKETSGLLVVAKSDAANTGLADQFAAHTVDRAYRAFCFGTPAPAAGRIEGAIGRHPSDRKRMAVRPPGRGKPAVTHYRTLEAYRGASLLECRLETGRTHQIRVHMSHIGHPLIGDPVYGRSRGARLTALSEAGQAAARAFQRQALHAGVLGFTHPLSGESLRFESLMPQDMADLAEALSEAG